MPTLTSNPCSDHPSHVNCTRTQVLPACSNDVDDYEKLLLSHAEIFILAGYRFQSVHSTVISNQMLSQHIETEQKAVIRRLFSKLLIFKSEELTHLAFRGKK